MEGSDNVEVAFQSALNTILLWDSTVAAGEGISRLLLAVDDVRRWMESTAGEAASDDRSKADNAMSSAMALLKREFENILNSDTAPRYSTCSSSLSDSSSYELHDEDDMDYDLPSPETISDLRSIAVRMNPGGYLGECVEVYSSARKALVNLYFNELGVKRLSTGDVRRMEWQLLDLEIKKWIRAVKRVRIIFTKEWRLCEQVFQGLGNPGTDSTCFRMAVKDAATHFFDFAYAITNIRPSPERLFRTLDIHEALSDLLPYLDVLFSSTRIQVAEVVIPRLSEVVREILQRYEDDLLLEVSPELAPGGAIHTLTIYAMKYVVWISNYEQTLTRLIAIKPEIDWEIPTAELIKLEERTPLELHLIWILEKLRFKLEDKSKHYANVSLANFFMMNNIQYVVGEILTCPKLRGMITNDFLTRLTKTVQQAATSYERATFEKVLSCLRLERLKVKGLSKSAFKKRIKTFNSMFEEVHKTQVKWYVPDFQLRKDLRLSITQNVLSAYGSFTEQHSNVFGRLKYTPEDLEAACLELFEGDVPGGKPSETAVESKPSASIKDTLIRGREEDKDTLISKLLSSDGGLSVISVVGVGGIGKTALAEVAYNCDEATSHFDKIIRVDVTEHFDQVQVAKAIVKNLEGDAPNLAELESVLCRISRLIANKRFLLVLDDVWTGDKSKWEAFLNALRSGASGSKILVTARNEMIAKMMSSAHTIQLGQLSRQDCWSLFSRIAFSGRSKEEYEQLKDIGRKIADRCKGSPIAAKTVGRLMRFKNTAQDWQDVLDDIWEWEEAARDIGNKDGGITSTDGRGGVQSSAISVFPKLKKLTVSYMRNWEEWDVTVTGGAAGEAAIEIMPCLRYLKLSHCDKLKMLPQPLLQMTPLNKLRIHGCPLLQQRYQEERGEDRMKISDIPKSRIS
ncbi:hypothetical protein RJ640_014586 [Escallonia rubra]|uniref:Exocyst subunit Exo70 family protein n=1 Tax=Escallonia rubra TaxID=112253 RepID=A0AA88UJK9_9ASTE|nr:hypothetical protein RJ640_014586 [Escallonia rubra]